MGYRAKYLIETMDMLMSLGGKEYLHKSRNEKDDAMVVQDKLQDFHGVGDRLCRLVLFKQDNVIPVDTHVWNLGRRDYDVNGLWKDTNSRTPTVYRQVGDMFLYLSLVVVLLVIVI